MNPMERQYRILRCDDITKTTLLQYLSLTEIPKQKWSWSDVELFARIDAHLADCENCTYKFHLAVEHGGEVQGLSPNLQQEDKSNWAANSLLDFEQDRVSRKLVPALSDAVERVGGDSSVSERLAFADTSSSIQDGLRLARPHIDTLIQRLPRLAAAAEDETNSTILGTLPAEVIRNGRNDPDDIGVTIMPRVTSTGMLTMNLLIPSWQNDSESFSMDLIAIHPGGSPKIIDSGRIVAPGHEVDLLVPLSEDLRKAWCGQEWKWADIPLRLRLTAVQETRKQRGPTPTAEAASVGPVLCASRSS